MTAIDYSSKTPLSKSKAEHLQKKLLEFCLFILVASVNANRRTFQTVS